MWLIATDMVHIQNWGTLVTTPKVAVAKSEIRVQTEVVNDLGDCPDAEVETTIYDEDDNALQKVSTPVTIKAKSSKTSRADAYLRERGIEVRP